MASQPQYVDLDYVKVVGSMPPADLDAVAALFPQKFDGIATAISSIFEAKLHKRYATPFNAPYPEALRWHVAQCVVAEMWRMRGYNPGHPLDAVIELRRAEALKWLDDAADSKDGLIELPKRADLVGSSAVDAGGPRAYTETDPFTWMDRQRDAYRGR